MPEAVFTDLTAVDASHLAESFTTTTASLVSEVADILASVTAASLPEVVVCIEPEDEGPIFVPCQRSEDYAALGAALFSATTWGDLRRSLPTRLYRDTVVSCWGDDGEPDDEGFSRSTNPAICDGDFPGWLNQDILQWMPDIVRRRYGEVIWSAVSGDAIRFSSDETDGVIEIR